MATTYAEQKRRLRLHPCPGGTTYQPPERAVVAGKEPGEIRLAAVEKEEGTYRYKHYRKTNGYANMPLDGIWLRAPYLHNGRCRACAISWNRATTGRRCFIAATMSTTRKPWDFSRRAKRRTVKICSPMTPRCRATAIRGTKAEIRHGIAAGEKKRVNRVSQNFLAGRTMKAQKKTEVQSKDRDCSDTPRLWPASWVTSPGSADFVSIRNPLGCRRTTRRASCMAR